MNTETKRLYLRKESRVLKRSDFLRIQNKGKKIHSKFVVLSVLDSAAGQNKGPSRIGITVTKKVSKLATKRNKFKRRVRDFFRLAQREIKTGCDLVVIAKSGATELTNKDFRDELTDVFMRAKKMRILDKT